MSTCLVAFKFHRVRAVKKEKKKKIACILVMWCPRFFADEVGQNEWKVAEVFWVKCPFGGPLSGGRGSRRIKLHLQLEKS